jgi:hypothetical protein
VKFSDPIFPAIFTPNQDLRPFDKSLITALGNWAMSLKGILDGGISLTDNWDAVVASYTSNATPDTEDEVAHGLGRVPTYFLVADINKGGIVYRGGTTFTKTKVYLKNTVASAAVKVILL